MPAQAGIQFGFFDKVKKLDTRFRGCDDLT